MFDSADVYSDGLAEEVLGKAIAGRPRSRDHLDEGDFSRGKRTQRRRLLASSSAEGLRGEPAPTRDGLYRPLPLHGFDGQTPIEETLARSMISCVPASCATSAVRTSRLAPDEVAGDLREVTDCPRYVAHQAYYSLIGRE